MDRRSFTKVLIAAAAARITGSETPRTIPLAGLALERADTFDVRNFGARGNGVDDDSAAFVRALAAAAVHGGLVIVPAGEYPVQPTLRLASGVTIRGVGARSILKRVGGEPIVLLAGDMQHVAIQDLAIAGSFAHGVLFERCSLSRVSGCDISGAIIPRVGYASGIFVVQSNGVTIDGCRLHGNGGSALQAADIQCDGLGKRSHDIRIENNDCQSTDAAINVRCYDLSESLIRGNRVSGARIIGAQNNGYGILIYQTASNPGSCTENTVSGNTVSHTQGSAIYLAQSNHSQVLDNVIDNVATVQNDITLPVAAIALNQSQYVTVLRNAISNSGRAGVSIASDRPGVGHVEVRGNVISDAAGYGIHLRGILRDVHITANKISRTNGGIGGDTKDEQDDIEISDNILNTITSRPAIRLGNASRSTVSKNTVLDAASYGLDLDFRDDSSVVNGNIVKNAGTSLGKGSDSVRVMRRGNTVPGRP